MRVLVPPRRLVSCDDLRDALSCGRPGCVCSRGRDSDATVHCPAHNDRHPSLHISNANGRLLLYCFAGCEQQAVSEALRERGLWPDRSPGGTRAQPPAAATAVSAEGSGLTLAQLAAAKRLPLHVLTQAGCREWHPTVGRTIVVIPYRGPDGEELAVHYRQALEGPDRFFWRRNDHPAPYGLNRLDEARALGWLLIVEGETDCWTGWLYGIPCLGIPG